MQGTRSQMVWSSPCISEGRSSQLWCAWEWTFETHRTFTISTASITSATTSQLQWTWQLLPLDYWLESERKQWGFMFQNKLKRLCFSWDALDPEKRGKNWGSMQIWFKSTSLEWSGSSLVAQMVKESTCSEETWVWSLGWDDPLEEGMPTHSSILAWRIPWTEDLVGYSPWGCRELDVTEWLSTA